MKHLQSGIIVSCIFAILVNGQPFSNPALTSALLNALGGNWSNQGQTQVPGRSGLTGSQRRPGSDRSGFELGASVPVGDRMQAAQDLQRAQETKQLQEQWRRQQEVIRRQQEEQRKLRERQQRQREEQLRQQQQAAQAAVPVRPQMWTEIQQPNQQQQQQQRRGRQPRPDRISDVPPPLDTGSQAAPGAGGNLDIMQILDRMGGGIGGGAGGGDLFGMGGGGGADLFGLGATAGWDMFGGGTTGAPDLFGGAGGAGGGNPFGALQGGGSGGFDLASVLAGGGLGGAPSTGAGAGAPAGSGAAGGVPAGGAGAGFDLLGGAPGAGMGAAGMAGLLNPMGPGRPFVPGMDANQVADLMGGRPGPVPMDIAQEAAALRAIGWTPDQIADTLGDKLQRRFSNPMATLAESALMSALAGAGATGAVGPQMPGSRV